MSEWKTMGWSPNIAPGERYGGAKPSRTGGYEGCPMFIQAGRVNPDATQNY